MRWLRALHLSLLRRRGEGWGLPGRPSRVLLCKYRRGLFARPTRLLLREAGHCQRKQCNARQRLTHPKSSLHVRLSSPERERVSALIMAARRGFLRRPGLKSRPVLAKSACADWAVAEPAKAGFVTADRHFNPGASVEEPDVSLSNLGP